VGGWEGREGGMLRIASKGGWTPLRSVHYSDYLEHNPCIQDEFTKPTSSCIMSSQLVLSSTWQKIIA
jgi:hypothetical protein